MLYPHSFGSKPDAQGRQACSPGTEDPQGSGQRELFSSKSHTRFLLERLRQRAEPFVSNPTPKLSTNLLPITAEITGRTPPDRQESLVPLVEIGDRRSIWAGIEGLAPAAPPEELISSQNHRKSYRTLSSPHTLELGSPRPHRGLSAMVVYSHTFLPIFAEAKQTHLP